MITRIGRATSFDVVERGIELVEHLRPSIDTAVPTDSALTVIV